MDPAEIDHLLRDSLRDGKLATAESRSLDRLLAGLSPDEHGLAYVRHRAFQLAREHAAAVRGDAPWDWLEDVIKRVAHAGRQERPVSMCDAYFSATDDCAMEIVRLIHSAKATLDICVFTVTDDRISDAILDVYRRGIQIRLISDDDKSTDTGSDVRRFEHAGMEVRLDRTVRHMHHKFAIFDEQYLLNGSYNWTRGASFNNVENFVVTDEPRLVNAFQKEFNRLWHSLSS